MWKGSNLLVNNCPFRNYGNYGEQKKGSLSQFRGYIYNLILFMRIKG